MPFILTSNAFFAAFHDEALCSHFDPLYNNISLFIVILIFDMVTVRKLYLVFTKFHKKKKINYRFLQRMHDLIKKRSFTNHVIVEYVCIYTSHVKYKSIIKVIDEHVNLYEITNSS